MQLRCKRCNAQIHADDIHMGRLIARCRSCHAVFGFADDVEGAAGAAQGGEGAGPRRQRPVPMPEGLRVEDTGLGLRIVRSWWHPMFIFLLFFCVAWNGFLVFWFQMTASTNAPWIFKLFPIGHVAVGLGLAYFVLAGFLNRTVIEVSDRELEVRHEPLPWPGSRKLPAASLAQLYCQEHRRHGQHGSVHCTYQLHAIDTAGRKQKLLSGMSEADQALYIEQVIEDRLGIEDRAVTGEFRG